MTEAPPKPKPKRKGGGRKPGQVNRLTQDIKLAVLISFDMVGAAKYLVRQAEKNPVAYMNLLGKVIPTQVNANITDFTYTIQQIVLSSAPASGVINTGLPPEPLRLVANDDKPT